MRFTQGDHNAPHPDREDRSGITDPRTSRSRQGNAGIATSHNQDAAVGRSRDIPGTGAVDIDQGREPSSRPGPNMRNCALSGETASRMSPYPDMWSYLPACLNSTRSDIFERDSSRSDLGGALARTHCAAACVAPNRKDVRWDRLRQPWRDRCWEAGF